MASLAKSALQTGNFLLAPHQLCLQNSVRVDLAGSILFCFFRRREGGRDQSGLHGAAFFKLMSLCIRGWSCILHAGRDRRQRAAATYRFRKIYDYLTHLNAAKKFMCLWQRVCPQFFAQDFA